MNRPRLVCIVFLLAVVTLTVFSPLLTADFIERDDGTYVTENPYVKAGLTWAGWRWAFQSSGYASNWHPVSWLSHMLDVQLFGMNPHAHHAVNILFHAVNASLLFLVLNGMTGAFWPCAVTAALFAVHPLHVESVAWISERKDVISTFFWFLTMLAYLGYVRRPGIRRYLFVVVSFALGLMAKPMLVTLPCVLLILDWWPLQRVPSLLHFNLREKSPLLLLSVVASVATYQAQAKGGATVMLRTTFGERLANALVSIATYLAKTVFPQGLSFFYPYSADLSPLRVLAALALVVLATAGAIRARRRFPFATVGWFWFLGTLVPVLGLIQVGEQAMADRYTYVPIIGIFMIVAWGADTLANGSRMRTFVVAGVTLFLGLMVAGRFQAGHWMNTETVCTQALNVTADNYPAHENLASFLVRQERFEEAIPHYREMIRLAPKRLEAYLGLGFVYSTSGHFEKEIAIYRQALAIDPGYARIWFNLSQAYESLGRVREAADAKDRAMMVAPASRVPIIR